MIDISYTNTPYIAINEHTQETFEDITDIEGNTEIFYSYINDEVNVNLKLDTYISQLIFDDDIPYSFVDYITKAEVTGDIFEDTTNEGGHTNIS